MVHACEVKSTDMPNCYLPLLFLLSSDYDLVIDSKTAFFSCVSVNRESDLKNSILTNGLLKV
jgi:hypothetical protein